VPTNSTQAVAAEATAPVEAGDSGEADDPVEAGGPGEAAEAGASGEATARKIGLDELASIEPLWLALYRHHAELLPTLAGLPLRSPQDSWERRRKLYEGLLLDDSGFLVVAEIDGGMIGYGAVRIADGLTVWQTGDRIAVGETLSILPQARGKGIAEMAIGGVVFAELAERGITELTGRTTETNDDGLRFFTDRGGTAINTVLFYRLPGSQATGEGAS
jgi:GNAT superfamily N-acetyltransferase